MCLYKLWIHCTFDVTKVQHSCVIIYLHVVHFHSTVLNVYFYTYEGISMCLYKLQVHSTFDVTKVEHGCVIDEVFDIVHLHFTVIDVYYLHL